MRIALLNPNTSQTATADMVRIAAEVAGAAATIEGMTAAAGPRTIADPAALEAAAAEVARMIAAAPAGTDAAIVSAFGDPGLAAAQARWGARATGLAAAAIGAVGRRRFAIATTTPALDESLRRLVLRYGADDRFTGTFYARAGLAAMADPDRLVDELGEACAAAVRAGAEAVIIGGGPLAVAARRLRGTIAAELIEPVPAAVRHLLAARAG